MSNKRSVLTFNMSTKNRANISSFKEPFQIMPATQNYISEKTLGSYVKGSNPNLVLHMNYITHVFSSKATTNDSSVRHSLRMYVKLAKVLGTKDILIHLPASVDEWNNLAFGLGVIKDEIIDNGCIVHLEIPSFSKDLLAHFGAGKDGDPKEYMSVYLETILEYCSEFDVGTYMLVPDTAHLWANGCVTYEHFEHVIMGYRELIKYIHLNGNIVDPFKMDTHAPIFDTKYNKLACKSTDGCLLSSLVANMCGSMGVICIAEITKYGLSWDEWTKAASEHGFDIVEYNEMFTI